jgi:hypothetical protein
LPRPVGVGDSRLEDSDQQIGRENFKTLRLSGG